MSFLSVAGPWLRKNVVGVRGLTVLGILLNVLEAWGVVAEAIPMKDTGKKSMGEVLSHGGGALKRPQRRHLGPL